ncbi:RNT2 Ribonuclease, partial [Atractosteus spatula]|nr:RNT2 Ribonuclease [Atractosteus spatula]
MKAFSLVLFLCLGHTVWTMSNHLYKHDWKRLILTHHWPQTLCSLEHITCSQFNYWTLHGLWTDKGDMCNSSWPFDERQIEDLMPEMNKWWPDLLQSGATKFWSHEWQKHGTCAAQLESLNSEHKYFGKALELYKKVDLDGILKKFNIVPSTKYYSLDEIEGTIVNFYRVKPKIQCVMPKEEEEAQTLGQIEICFDKEFQLVDCVHSKEELSDRTNDHLTFGFHSHYEYTVCDESLQVYYPPTQERS